MSRALPTVCADTELALSAKWRAHAKRWAQLSFWLFFLKGLLWLLVPVVLAWWSHSAVAMPVHSMPVDDQKPEAQELAIQLEPIVVTGTRTAHALSDSPVAVQLITAAQINDSGARDVAELLEREGGVTVTRVAGRGTRIEIQGMSSEQVLILVDGRRVIGRINGAIDLSRLKVASIERIEIVKGPSSALYGSDALGGVVNVISKAGGNSSTVTLRADTGENYQLFGSSSYQRERYSGNASGGTTRTSPFDLDKNTPAIDGINGRSRFFNLNHRQRISPAASLGASLDYALDDSHRVDAGSATFDVTKRIEEVRAGLAPQFEISEQTSATLDLYYSRYYDQYLQDQRGSDANDRFEQTVDQLYAAGGQVNHRVAHHQLSLGLETQFEKLVADRLSKPGERDRQSVFLQDELRLLADDALSLVPGLRYDRDSQFGNALSPKLALRYNLSRQWFVRAGAGLGYRAPDFKQLLLHFDNPAVGYRVEGNSNLKPERSTGINLSSTWLAMPNLSLSGTVFHNRVKDLIDIIQTTAGRPMQDQPVVFSYLNIAHSRLTGTEVQVEWQPLRPLSLRLGHGWLLSKDLDTGKPLSGRAKHRANLDLEFKQPRYALGLRGVWIGKREFQVELATGGAPTGAGTAAPYALLDARAQWRGWQVLKLSLGVANLFDAGESRFLPIQPRSVFFEMSKEFT